MAIDLESGAMWYGAFVFSTACHEATHAWSALHLGDDTAARGGQVTLDPWPHIKREPFGMVVVPILSWLVAGWIIGWASAPYNPVWAQENPKKAGLMALAGPMSNLVLALAGILAIRLGYEWRLFRTPYVLTSTTLAVAAHSGLTALCAKFLSIFVTLNLILCVFNLVPLPPLDGSNAPLLLLPKHAADAYARFLRTPATRYFGLLIASRLLGPVVPKLLFATGCVLYPATYHP